MLHLSENGIKLIHDSESFEANAYPDSKGIPTIGYGTTRINGQPVRLGMSCTKEQAIEWFNADVRDTLDAIERLMPADVLANQNKVDALCSFAYNVGTTALKNSSLRRAILDGAPIAEDLFTRWNKIRDPKTGQMVVLNGLTKRRKREFQLYTS